MAKKISQYTDANLPALTDRLLGTKTNQGNATGNFTLESIRDLFGSNTGAEVVLTANSAAASQTPSGTDTPLQLEMGAAQGTTDDDVMIDANGVITFNTAGLYFIQAYGNLIKDTSPTLSIMQIRQVVNGAQYGATQSVGLLNSDPPVQYRYGFPFVAEAGDEMAFQAARDDEESDDGKFIAIPVSAGLTGWNPSPSFGVSILKY